MTATEADIHDVDQRVRNIERHDNETRQAYEERVRRYDEQSALYEQRLAEKKFLSEELGHMKETLGRIEQENKKSLSDIGSKVNDVYSAVFGNGKPDGSLLWRMSKIEDRFKMPGTVLLILIQIATLITLILKFSK